MSDNPNVPHNTEDKNWWLKHGEEWEKKFCEVIAPKFGLEAIINPEKAADPTKPDLIVDDKLSDLKVQNTPFFTASRYKKNPTYTVTFNKIDLDRYLELYPKLDIYFYVNWNQLSYSHRKFGTIKVSRVVGLWKTDPQSINDLVVKGEAPLHAYQRRKYDTAGNAKASYLISLDDLLQIQSVNDNS